MVRVLLALVILSALPLSSARAQSNLLTLTARSEYPPAIVQDVERLADPFAESDRDAPREASYLQYEPQNEPPPGDLPPQIEAAIPPISPSLSPPAAPRELPWIVPYSWQFLSTWTSGSGDDLGILDLDARLTLVAPKVSGLLITPGFAAHVLNGPTSTDLPSAIYDNWIEVRWLKKFNDQWSADLAISPSLFTDYNNVSSGAVRIMGRAIAIRTLSPEWQIAFGVIYLDRDDIRAMPGGGMIWTPNDGCKMEMLFPRPRMMWRMSGDDTQSRWLYLGGEFAGGTYGIFRPNVAPYFVNGNDTVTYSAMRMFVGYEAKRAKGFSPRIEAGWTFSRSLKYGSGIGDRDLPSAAMLRIGGSF